jgi:hypothetical protein
LRDAGKVHGLCVNGRTGSVQGERPYSAGKIACAILLAVILVGLFLAVHGGQLQ